MIDFKLFHSLPDFFLFSFKFLQIYGKFQKRLDFSKWLYDLHVELSNVFDPYLLQLGNMLLVNCPVHLFSFSPSHFSPIGDIRILSIPSMCILPDLFRMLLPQKRTYICRLSKSQNYSFLQSFPFFSWFELTGIRVG